MPLRLKRLTLSATSAAPTNTFLGSQPRSAQVPPKGRESMMATLHPARRHLWATVVAAVPVPTTTKLNRRVTMAFLSRRRTAATGADLLNRQAGYRAE
jgi:hypothetical protein